MGKRLSALIRYTLFTIPSANMKQCELQLILLHELFSIYQQFCVYIV